MSGQRAPDDSRESGIHTFLIRDQIDGPQQLPLDRLLSRVLAVSGCRPGLLWVITHARGYGIEVCELEDSLSGKKSVEVEPDRLVRIARDKTQWFYDLHCIDDSVPLLFGLQDSTALYVRGREALCREVSAVFDKVTIVVDG